MSAPLNPPLNTQLSTPKKTSPPGVGSAAGPASNFHLSYGPHIRSELSTTQIMWMVNFSLLPALIWAFFIFGWNVLAITLFSILGAYVGEFFICYLRKRKSTLADGSAFCSGLLMAYTLPPGLPAWMPFVGSVLAIIFVKGLFGGLGYNIFNVALIGRAMLMATYPVPMTTAWTLPRWMNYFPPDGTTTSTPLALMKEKGLEAAVTGLQSLPNALSSSTFSGFEWNYFTRLIFGLRPGSIGEVSVLFILLGASFLLWKRIIKLYVPLSILVGLFFVSLLSEAPLIHLFSGGVWLGAFFMATDYVTCPIMPKGQIVYGLLIGLLTGVIRLYGGYPEGICYAILLMNIVTTALNDWFRPTRVSTMGVPS